MNKKFTSYQELTEEKLQLETLLSAQKKLVQLDIEDIRGELEPALNVVGFIKSLTIRNKHNPVIHTGVNMAIDFLANKTNGPHAGLIRTSILPFILKNFATNFLTRKTKKFVMQILSSFTTHYKKEEPVPEDHTNTPD